MEFEAVEPTHSGFAPPRQLFERLVTVDAAGVGIDAQWHQRGRDHCHKTTITQHVGKLSAGLLTRTREIKPLEGAVVGWMEGDQDRQDLTEHPATATLTPTLAAGDAKPEDTPGNIIIHVTEQFF